MSPLEGFLATWSRALQTFGEGMPAAGSQIDRSDALRGLQTEVEFGAPGEQWLGAAALAYQAANTRHAEMIGMLADLDARLAGEIDRSARVVTSGRAELDTLRDRVVGAASSVPGDQAGHAMLMAIVSDGLAQLSAIVSKSDRELNAISASIQQIGADYEGLSRQGFTA